MSTDIRTEYRDAVDRADWPAGPWDDEPDKVVWVDPDSDLDCMIRRGGGGAWCGYVGVPPEHPWYGVYYSGCIEDPQCDDGWECGHSSPDGRAEVHGGLTFSGACREEGDPASAICHVPQPGRTDDVWWFGFDCSHAWDLRPGSIKFDREHGFRRRPDEVYRDEQYVIQQTLELARQLAEVS